MKVGIISGGFDPLHKGHISYINSAKEHCDILVVGCNTDEWLARKKGRPFMSYEDRKAIVENLKGVHCVLEFNDDDDSSFDLITRCKNTFSAFNIDEFIFMNGGDRTKENIPEEVKAKQSGYDDVKFMFGVGGEDKKNSSSWILKKWSQPTVERKWGTYKVLDKNGSWTVKELSFDTNKSLSDQRHFHRDEHWHIVKGTILMELEYPNGDILRKNYKAGESIDIMKGTWHKATNVGDEAAKVIEVWVGENLSEDDIERRD